jgi:hypothetical protein
MSCLNHSLSILALLTLLTSCDRDECESGQARCLENVAQYCGYQSSDDNVLRWVSEDCGQGACQLGSQQPFCALDEAPDPRCGPDFEDSACDGASLMRCRDGFAVSVTDCVTGESSSASGRAGDIAPAGYCVAESLCSTEPEPSELCPSEGYASSCDGNTLIQCQAGFITSRQPCGALFCAVTPGYADCMLEPEPSPLCTQDALIYVCDGPIIVECHYGYRGFEQPCGAGLACRPGERDAFCGASP